jgi:hypothetical protein
MCEDGPWPFGKEHGRLQPRKGTNNGRDHMQGGSHTALRRTAPDRKGLVWPWTGGEAVGDMICVVGSY